MKTGVSAGLLLIGIGLILFSYVWQSVLAPPITDEDGRLLVEIMDSHHEPGSASETPKSAEQIAQDDRMAEAIKAKVRAREQKVSIGKFALKFCGIIAVVVGGGLYLWTRAQEE